MPRPLRTVRPGETPGSAKTKTIVDAADKGTRLELLVALRLRLAVAVQDPNTPPRDLAALSRRLIEVARDIEAIETQEDGDGGSATPDEAWEAI